MFGWKIRKFERNTFHKISIKTKTGLIIFYTTLGDAYGNIHKG